MTEPRTAAGRALLEREALNSRSFALITAEAILAIEAEAASSSTSRNSEVPAGNERARAVTLATWALDDASRDPDSDLSVLARQFLREIDRAADPSRDSEAREASPWETAGHVLRTLRRRVPASEVGALGAIGEMLTELDVRTR